MPVSLLSISHQGQFPAVTISFNLAPGVALGQADRRGPAGEAELGAPATLTRRFQGTAQAFQQSLGTEPILILAALVVGLHHPGHPLRELHPPAHHPLHPAVGGRGRARDPDGVRLRPQRDRLIGIILLIGIVKKNGIMMVDFALAAERDEHLSPEQSIRKAAILRLPPDHDDDAWRPCSAACR